MIGRGRETPLAVFTKAGAIGLFVLVFFLFMICACVPAAKKEMQTRFMQKGCDTCHLEDIIGFRAKRFIHESLNDQECKACHRPHGMIGVVTLWENTEAKVCFTCHKKEEGLTRKEHQHPVFKQGKCSPCHDPHSSDHQGLLKAEGNQLCYLCHDKKAFDRDIVHKPLAEKGCLVCHDSHATDHKGEIKYESGSMCIECHPLTNKDLIDAHQGYKFEGQICIDCHDPHSSNFEGLLKKSAHRPFTEGKCQECHFPPVSEDPYATREQGAKLCFRCHDALAKETKGPFMHEPAGKGDCLVCHDPHTSDYSKLLLEEERQLCYSCHKRAQEEFSRKWVHTPLKDDNCSSCHTPHGSSYRHQLKKEGVDLCKPCHAMDDFSGPFVHASVSKGECLNCHDPHATDFKALTKMPVGALCFSCHSAEKEWTQMIHPHTPVSEGDCLGCHQPHRSDHDNLLTNAENTLCFDCHKTLLEAAQEGSLHPLSQKGECMKCHDPHASGYPYALRTPADRVCLGSGCHGQVISDIAKSKFVHKPFEEKDCVSCHTPHGSKLPHNLLAPSSELCLFCHKDMKQKMEAGEFEVIHIPVRDGECFKCHTGHGSDFKGLVLGQIQELCSGCHDLDGKGFRDSHHGIPASGEKCLICHEPHLSKDDGLFQPVVHEPFKKNECRVCHE